jgi:biofilm PGA synthesis N-glycosyltransferase PgaC
MPSFGELLVAFVALYPVFTAALWVAGGVVFRWLEEASESVGRGDWPAVSVLIPACDEEPVIATAVGAALAADYPELELLVLDDGSSDATAAVAERAACGDPRCRVIRDPVNLGKAERLNRGLRVARHDLVLVTDADTHMHPQALKRLVARMLRAPRLAAVAGAPHVTNRDGFLPTMQILEAASIIGLIRRTQSLAGRVATVAGVLGLFRRDRVLAVGGYDPRMATEDIDLTWRLLLAGWTTAYEPRALVGMQVPTTLRSLWAQRRRWARGQGEVLRAHLGEALWWRNHWMWLVALEAVASLLWVLLLAAAIIVAALGLALDESTLVGFGLTWGIALAVIATLQVTVALLFDKTYDPQGWLAFLAEPLYPLLFWLFSALAALRAETVGLALGPESSPVLWHIPRDSASR